jgi:hypothetical protein
MLEPLPKAEASTLIENLLGASRLGAEREAPDPACIGR